MSQTSTTTTQETPLLTRAEVILHNSASDAWVIVDNHVYDVSKFAEAHPGGTKLLLDYAGKDVTEEFWDLHRGDVLQKYHSKLLVGRLSPSDCQQERGPLPGQPSGELSQIPYAEVSHLQGFPSPYYNDSHVAFRKAIRLFLEESVLPLAPAMDEGDKEPPKSLYQQCARTGLFAARLGPGPHLRGLVLPGGVRGEEFDYFHEQIAHEEMGRVCCPGFVDGLGTGMVIGLPPVMVFGNAALKAKVVGECLRGEKIICLAISEPFAGSDVSDIKCTAVKSECGKFYIVNGVKKWITQGQSADYFTTAVRTSGEGVGGISLLLIERSEGVETKKIKTSYSGAAGTSYVIFENVRVPVTNLLGKEKSGFKAIMYNFNHERWFITCGINSSARRITEECFKWAQQRRVFGKPLIEQPVIRQKLAFMVSRVEAVQNWIDHITFQMNRMSYKQQSTLLAGPIALLKQYATRCCLEVSDQSCQIFGGRAITRTGMGQMVERVQRSIKFGAILGGSEEIMADLGIRQAMKYYPKKAKL